MKPTRSGAWALAALFACALAASGCARQDKNPIPPAGTSVTSTSEVFRQTAGDLQDYCNRTGGCTCILDGLQTTCAVVFACLDAGFCELVSSP